MFVIHAQYNWMFLLHVIFPYNLHLCLRPYASVKQGHACLPCTSSFPVRIAMSMRTWLREQELFCINSFQKKKKNVRHYFLSNPHNFVTFQGLLNGRTKLFAVNSTASKTRSRFANTRSPSWWFHFLIPVLWLALCSLFFHTPKLILHHTFQMNTQAEGSRSETKILEATKPACFKLLILVVRVHKLLYITGNMRKGSIMHKPHSMLHCQWYILQYLT
jgi:hypothetical protein